MNTKAFRLNKMDQYIMEHKMVTMEELSKNFGLSINTVRVDIQELEKMGRIQKVYGGACSRQNHRMMSFEERSRKCIMHKKAIAYQAAELVEEGDTIFIDSGTTAVYMVDYLDENKDITILTNNLGVVLRAMKKTGIHLICLPGELERTTNSFVSDTMSSVLRNYQINKSFFTTAGITTTGEVTVSFPLEHVIKQQMIKYDSENYLLTDSTKYGNAGGFCYANIEDFDGIVTDDDAEDIFLKLCKSREVYIKIADKRMENYCYT